MKRIIIAAMALFVPNLAHAKLGFTSFQGVENATRMNYGSYSFRYPSLDWHGNGFLLQMHALDLIEGLTYGDPLLRLSANFHKTTVKKRVNEPWGGVFQPGGSVEITQVNSNDIAFTALGLARAGMQSAKGFGFGVYVVPGMGVGMVPNGAGDSELELMISGSLQVSVWSN